MWVMGYLDQLRPFLILFQTLEGSFPHQHLEGQDADCPNVPLESTVHPLRVLRRQILQRSYNLLLGPLFRVLMRISKIAEFDCSLSEIGVTLEIMMFSSFTSACTMPRLCR
jgi:hypothetical protein